MPSTRSRLFRRVAAGLLLFGALLYPGGSAAVTVDVNGVRADPEINEFLSAGHKGWIAYTANSTMDNWNWERTKVYADPPTVGSAVRVSPAGSWAQSGGFNGSTLLFSAWTGRTDADIYKFDLNTRQRTKFGPAVNSRHDDYRPTMSGDWLLFTRHNRRTDIYKVILFNRSSGALRVLATSTDTSFVGAGQVNGDWVVYQKSRSAGTRVFRYNIVTRETQALPNDGRPHAYSASIASDGTAFYARSRSGCGANTDIVRSVVGGATEKVFDMGVNQDIAHTYVEATKEGGRRVHLTQIQCNRATHKWMNVYVFDDIYELDVDKSGTGTGTVTSVPHGISCGSDCTQVIPYGSQVTLTATPDPGSVVAGWSISECGTSSECVVDVLGDQAVEVTFQPAP